MEKMMLSPAQTMEACVDSGVKKAARGARSAFLLAIVAGALIAFAAAATNTAAHTAETAGAVRLICGLLFPFGLGIVVLMGTELFTGNCLMVVPALEGKISWGRMVQNWAVVYLGNFLGSLAVAAICVYGGQLGQSDGGLAVFTMKLAAGKCSLSFPNGLLLGIGCNILVCLGVLCAMTAKDTTGKILGAFLPVCLFVLCGFEHSVANMFYIPAGLLAKAIPAYAELAVQAGLDLSRLTWGNFLLANLLPVTLGNILGGAGIGLLLRKGHKVSN